MFSRIKHALGILNADTAEPTNFEKYVRTLPIKDGTRYLMLVEARAVNLAVLQRIRIPNTIIIRTHGSIDAVQLFEMPPVQGIQPEGESK